MNAQKLCTGDRALVTHTLRAYRTFRLNGAGQVRSTNADHVWSGLEQHARCISGGGVCWCGLHELEKRPEHDAPASDCTCGLYGWYAPDDARIVGWRVRRHGVLPEGIRSAW